MKNLAIVFFLVSAFFILTPIAASAQQYGFYLTPKLFYSHIKSDTGHGGYSDNVAGGAGAFGYDLNILGYAPVRLELEWGLRGKTKYDEVVDRWVGGKTTLQSKTSVTSIFANMFYDFHNQGDFTPYIGAGLGTARTRVENKWRESGTFGQYSQNKSKSNWDFAWNVGAGVSYKLIDEIAVDMGYRYADFGTLDDLPDMENVDIDGSGHEVMLGLRLTF